MLSEKSELLLSIYSSVAQAKSESISANQKWGTQKRFLDGTYILSNLAYGYQTDTDRLLILEQEKALVVRFIFEEYLEGKGTWLIAKSLNEQRISTKTGKMNWIPVIIHKILKNPVYTGDLLLQNCSNRKKEQREQIEESEFKTKVVCGWCDSNFNR